METKRNLDDLSIYINSLHALVVYVHLKNAWSVQITMHFLTEAILSRFIDNLYNNMHTEHLLYILNCTVLIVIHIKCLYSMWDWITIGFGVLWFVVEVHLVDLYISY